MNDQLTPESLAKNIKQFMAQGANLEDIKTDAISQGITEDLWNQAVILVKQEEMVVSSNTQNSTISSVSNQVSATSETNIVDSSNTTDIAIDSTSTTVDNTMDMENTIETNSTSLDDRESLVTTSLGTAKISGESKVSATMDVKAGPSSLKSVEASSEEQNSEVLQAVSTKTEESKEKLKKTVSDSLSPEEQKKKQIFMIVGAIIGVILITGLVLTILN